MVEVSPLLMKSATTTTDRRAITHWSDLAPAVRKAVETISAAFDASPTVWVEAEQGVWYRVPVEHGDTSELADQLTTEHLCEAARSKRIRCFAESESTYGLAAYLPRAAGAQYAATLSSRLSPPMLAERLAEMSLERQGLDTRIEDLNAENDSFATQLMSDLEELSFLRSMVDQMGSAAGSMGLADMANQTLPVLNTSVRAKSLVLVTLAEQESNSAAEPNSEDNAAAPVELRVVSHFGVPIAEATVREIIERFGASARRGPVVQNWIEGGLTPTTSPPAGVQSIVVSCLEAGDRLWGWLIAINRQETAGSWETSWQLASDEFGSGEATLITTTAAILAMQAANLEMLREKEQILVSVVRSLVSAIESKDPYTRGHSERVALYTRRIAEQVGYKTESAERIYLAALLHDVGKIGVSDATLKKPGKLTSEEYAEISKHPDEGWAILCDLEQLRYVLPGVLHHHERWDGRGYPDGLAGEAIPRDGRVMAVADAYDAMTSDRPYRPGMPTEKAQAILSEGSGVQWDPSCVAAFFACLEDIHRIKEEYQQRERRRRKELLPDEEPLELPHEVTGLPE
ncbi:HD-GYP domain-containing protein [Botrimarina hoheduenensis]|uniref:Cyclic di-GMP phosphodiesterase response regulator RpfG n=1 Tax=Botrimarina hoheduenensis TaxID=2528000 RepID=A0A5C5VQR1_9BACT|nr:HD-GYP domain-containing protein [Botrimarina hoheduenensis]TWT40141.1 Cyclic di-GMP phosphodiesterase response regulator RpfG [Botrimarina hoheduenensis]